MEEYYKTNAIYETLDSIEHDFLWVSGNAWLLVYGNKNDQKAKVLVLTHGTSWKKQEDVIKFLKFLSKRLRIPIYKIMFDDSVDTSISEIAFSTILEDDGEMYFLNELKNIFKNAGLNIIDGSCDKYLNDKISSAYHKWQRTSLGNKIIVSDIDLIRMDEKKQEPIELIELKRSTAKVTDWKPYRDDFANFNLIDTISKQTNIPLTIVYNRMIKNKLTKTILKDIYNPVSIFNFSDNKYTVIERGYRFENFVLGNYLTNRYNATMNNNLSRCTACSQAFSPRIKGATLCIECWKKQQGYI